MPALIAGPDAGVEEVRFEEDLAVGNRDHVGRHERGDVARLRLDDRKRGQRAGLALDRALRELLDVFLVDARGALEQPRVQIEHVARIRSRPGGRRSSSEIWRYAHACLVRSS
jgi:hypothetical protein